MAALLTRLRETSLLLADGAWGSHAIEAGLDLDRDSADAWNLTRRDFVARLAGDYVYAGADILTTNTFGANRVRLARAGRESDVRAINEQGATIARAALHDRAGDRPPGLVAGAMGPAADPADSRLSQAERSDIYREQATWLIAGGADFILVETITDHADACVAVGAARAAGATAVVCSFAFRETVPGRFETWTGDPVDTALRAVLDGGADVVGANCIPATAAIIPFIEAMRRCAGSTPLWLKPNAGMPVRSGDGAPDRGSPTFSYPLPLINAPIDAILDALGSGVFGGCCGTAPADIAALRATLDRRIGQR